MNLGIPELLIVFVIGAALLAIPIVIVLGVAALSRRIRNLESRVEQLERRGQ